MILGKRLVASAVSELQVAWVEIVMDGRVLHERKISQALFETDPMNTCCKENDCFDEYDLVASGVARRLSVGMSLEQALSVEISEWFFDGEQFDQSQLKPVLELLGD